MNDPTALHPDGGPADAGDDGGWEKWRALAADAFARFQNMLLGQRPQYPGLTDYAPVERARQTTGTFAWWWGAEGEIRETINSINAWGVRVHEWGAWNLVVDSYEIENDRWDVLNHFVEPVAYFCMLQPSSLADRLTVAAETLLHQANQRIDPSQPDQLDQDALKPGATQRRTDRRKQLNRLGKGWSRFDAFRDALRALDSTDYRQLTRNFRDLSNHSFAPRLMIGEVTRAIRSIVPRTDMVEQPDGTYLPVKHPSKRSVQYAMQSLAPLPLDAARSANLAEYLRARTAMEAFAALINELCDRTDTLPKGDMEAPGNSI